jgi:hypothetical protein
VQQYQGIEKYGINLLYEHNSSSGNQQSYTKDLFFVRQPLGLSETKLHDLPTDIIISKCISKVII